MTNTISQEALAQLIQGVKHKNNSAIAEIFELYKDRVYYSALKITKNSADAEEVVQETFIKAIKNIGQLSNVNTFSSWLYKITTSTALDLLRKHHKYVQADEDNYLDNIIDEKEGPERMAFNKQVVEAIKLEISKMPDDIACVAVAKYFEEMSVDEIAEDLSLSPNTVKSRLRLFRERIQPILKEQGYDPNSYYSLAFIPVLATGFQYAMQRYAMNPNTSNHILHSIQKSFFTAGAGAVGTGLLVGLNGKAIGGAILAGGLVVGGSGIYLIGNSTNNSIDSINYSTNYTNSQIPVTVKFEKVFTKGNQPQVYYGEELLKSTLVDNVLTFEAGENGEYKIIYGRNDESLNITNIDEIGPSVENINYANGMLTFNTSDDLSGIDASASYIKNGNQTVYFDDIKEYNELYIDLGSISYMYIYDNAGNVTKCTLHNK